VSCYSAADLLVNPSLTESFPTTVVEAMSCGLPCVVTDTGASREIVGAVGGVVAAANAASLLVGIDEMLRLPADARRCMGVAARQRVVECFSLARMAAEFVGAYRSATGAGA